MCKKQQGKDDLEDQHRFMTKKTCDARRAKVKTHQTVSFRTSTITKLNQDTKHDGDDMRGDAQKYGERCCGLLFKKDEWETGSRIMRSLLERRI